MQVSGRYVVLVKEGDIIVSRHVTNNIVVNVGLQQMVDWLKYDVYGTGAYPGFTQIDTSGMSVTVSDGSNETNAIDGDTGSYYSNTITNTNWSQWWKIDFGVTKNLLALNVRWYEDDTSYGGDYKWRTSPDDAAWTDFPARLRPPQDASVGQVFFYVNNTPPLSHVSGVRYVDLLMKRFNDNENFRLYEVEFYEPNFMPQPPAVMALGTGTATPFASDTSLQIEDIRKVVTTTTQHDDYAVRYIMTLETTEGNDTSYTEAGMFFDPENYEKQTTANASSMLSRALFDTPWSKTNTQTADVYYELSVSDIPYEVSSSSST